VSEAIQLGDVVSVVVRRKAVKTSSERFMALLDRHCASGIPFHISVYPDKLMIWNPGQLPPQWTVERLLTKHFSAPFNPDVANAFFRAGLVESWGARDRAHAGNLPLGGPGRACFRACIDGGLGDVQLCTSDGRPPPQRNYPRNYPRTCANHPGTSLSAAPVPAPPDPPGACGTTVLGARRGEVPPAKTEGHGSDSACRSDQSGTLVSNCNIA